MKLAGQIFKEADVDGSGALDGGELCGIITQLFNKMGKELPHDYAGENLKGKIEKSMTRFDTDLNGTISFDEFLQMLCCAPWRAMLPPGIREEMPKLVIMAMGEGIPGVPRNKTLQVNAVDSAAAETLEVVRALFDKADGDSMGSIDEEEMTPLIRLMYKEWDKPIPHDFNTTLPEVKGGTMPLMS